MTNPPHAIVRDGAGRTLGFTPALLPIAQRFYRAPHAVTRRYALDRDGYCPIEESVQIADWAKNAVDAGSHVTRVDRALSTAPCDHLATAAH